jgi:hypothetical protein
MTSSAVLTVGKTAKAGLKNWKYGLMTQSIQLLTESVANREEVFDPNPIIMTKKIISNKEMMHNLGYMGNETFWTSGISTLNGNNTKRAYLICGVFSFVDSSAMNFFFKKEFDPKRVTLDTGWEILVGNFQTSQIDIPALDRYERAATQQGKPNLRLVGYAIAIADQTVGYFSYNKASEMVESSKDDEKALKPDVKLIPILAPK